MTSVPKQRAKLTLIEKGHILSACQFDKSMTEVQVQSSIIEMLGDKLPSNVDIEILMSAHNKLVKPTLPPGQGINGVILHRLFKTKPIYVLPDRQLIKTDCDDEDIEQLLEGEDDVFGLNMTNSNSSPGIKSKEVLESAVPKEQSNSGQASTRPLNQTSSSGSASTPRIICKKCCCTFPYGESCTRCTQDAEFKESLIADQQSSTKAPENNVAPNSFEVVEIENDDQPLDVEQLRSYRIAHLTGHDEPTEIPEEVSNDYPRESAKIVVKLEIHRTTVKQDLIKEFQDPSILDKEIEFKLINGRGDIEAGEGIGVAREVYSLFWNEFAISMTIGERERVPFVRHDHFIEEWQSMGRILVKGFTSVDYFPTFLSKASVCFCLFGTEVNDDIFLSSFKRYLSPLEEDLIDHILNSKELPEQMEELLDFLERFQCRSVVKKENVCRLLLEIAKQELVQKPHLMISAWRPILQNYLANYPQFQSIMGVTSLYEELTPTPKKVLNNILCNPSTDAERDALKFLQRFIRGLDHEKIAKFLQFTTGMDVMGTSPLKITFSTSQGFGSRPIAHTCSPLLELPTTYTNFVELREEFENILNQKTIWEIDIV